MSVERLQILINGQVQGVGFRPHIYRIAQSLNLTGWVQNNAFGVLIEVQGLFASSFLSQTLASLPPLAKIRHIETNNIALKDHEQQFQIIASDQGITHSNISPDTSPCSACLQELFASASRYYHYPFLNCTQCGPRFSITRTLPYDRRHTSMATFPLCRACEKDYFSVPNRRYHAQPIACKHCGPMLSTSIEAIAQALRAGQIVALKGLGGYQLLCDASSVSTVTKLRQRKNRQAKPFALMVLNTHSAEDLVIINDHAKNLLINQARPIVLLQKKQEMELIAPGLAWLGIMLPSTPLHYLLFHALANYPANCSWLEKKQTTVLVTTSANIASHPLITEDEIAFAELAPIADVIVSHDRKIITRVDDSVMRLINNKPVFIRRARGFAPESIPLPYAIPATLALGGHLKNTFCITRNDEAFVSQHIGSLTNKATIDFLHESLAHWQRFLNIKIERVACDLHPDFYTSRMANDYHLPIISVQHHHAHLAAVAAEHHILEPALGLVLDGYGYGLDGQAWGGELLLLKKHNFKRLSHFYPLPQPGGERAVQEPWRMAAAILHCLGKNEEITKRFYDKPQALLLANLLQSDSRLPVTSSCGRLFDAASALLGINTISQYEGQAAMQLESLVSTPEILAGGWSFVDGQFNLLPTFAYLLDLDPIKGANFFHGTLIAGLTDWLLTYAKKSAIKIILLSGGCFLNQVITAGLISQLEYHGLTVYLPQRIPVNDGGISLGQAWIAGNQPMEKLLCA